MEKDFTHLDKSGNVKMVNVAQKPETLRRARASGSIRLTGEIISKIAGGGIKKGNVLAASKIAGIMAAKKTWEIIPLCHQIKLAGIDIEFRINKDKNNIEAISTVQGFDRTGVEMEALAGVSVALLNIYDMCKALSKDLEISQIKLMEKTGGTHGR